MRFTRWRGAALAWMVLAGVGLGAGLGVGGAWAQAGGSGLGTASSVASAASAVSGVVINASTGLPVPRALVRMNARAMLTDHDGKFRFEQNTDTSVNILVTKPGFFFTTEYGDPGNVFLQGAQLAAPLELRLYPEALLTGTVLDPDGDPLSRVPVTAVREIFDDGGRRWIGSGIAITDGRGRFRLPVTAGVYRLETRYVARYSGTDEAILPVLFPQGSSSNTSQALEVHGGEEQHVDLHPGMGPTHAVSVLMRGTLSRGMRVIARSGGGISMQVSAMRIGDAGEVKIELPQGTYTLSAQTFGPDGGEEAETTVTVPDHDISGVVMQFSPVATIPVEMSVDGDSTSDNAPASAGQLGLMLRSVQADLDRGDGTVPLRQMPDRTFSFAAPAGSYRLQARAGGSWYVKAVNYGDSDLLQQDLAVAPGASGTPIRVTVSDRTGGVQGSVSLNGSPAGCWVYLVPTGPSAQVEMNTRSNAEGGYSFSTVPPGSYQAVAFERRHAGDYRDAQSLAAFSSHVHAVTVTAGDKTTVDLDAVPVSEMTP